MEQIQTTNIKDLLDCYPEVVQLFINHRLHCVGCPAEKFHTVCDTAKNHHLDLDLFSRSLQEVIAGCGDDYPNQNGQAVSI